LDGEAVDAMLREEAPKMGDSVYGGKDEDRPSWRITRRYASQGRKYGRRIDVFMESIGMEFPEFLVDYKDLVDAMEEHGLRPVDASEASSLGLCGGKATGMFEDLFKEMQDKHKGVNMHPAISAALAMSQEEKKYSFLNRWFVFVKSI
jgi:hypothetical protein